MDELAASLATSFAVSSDPNSTSAPHPRFSEYKKKSSGSDQDARRASILEQQKNKRFDYLNYMRRVVDDDWDNADDLDDDVASVESMEVSQGTDKEKKAYKPGRYYRNQLMLSEWMVEVPDDLEENWLMVCCPWGKRCLIVAAKGSTTSYGRNGYRVNSFPSLLPGGNRKMGGKDNAILDCIYHEVEKTFYVLDVMNWKNHPVYDSETDFRFFWMMSKLQETPEVSEVSNLNPYKFVPLNYHNCKKENLKEVFFNTKEKFDGCLFYCKKAHYTFGASPLVVWLKPYMIPEMLNIEVPEIMMSEKPVNYSTYSNHLQHIKDTKEKLAKEKKDNVANKKPTRRVPDRSRKFKMDLMESKWLLEIPERIDEDWSMVVCPVGQRCLVMAIDGETKSFTRTGHKLPGYFLTVLPGGNRYEYGYGTSVVTLMDCIYNEEMMTYFILDCPMWADKDMKGDGYWERINMMKKAIITRPEFKCITPLNMFKFVPLYNYDCTVDGLEKALKFSSFEVDGFLFYKKDGKYVSGETDEVLWLKPYMLPEVFNNVKITLPRRLIQNVPPTYTDFPTFAEEVRQGKHLHKKKDKKKKKKEFVPDVELQLPENPPAPKQENERKKNKKPAQASYLGPGIGFRGRGRGIGQGFYTGGRGGNRNSMGDMNMGNQRANQAHQFDSYGRLLAASGGGDNQGNARVYGKGSVSGYSYFGDDRDIYYPDYPPVQGGAAGAPSRRIRGGQTNQSPFGMGDMENALNFYNFDQGPKQNQRRVYKMF